MKTNLLFSGLMAIISLSGFTAAPREGYSVRGDIVGIPDGSPIVITSMERFDYITPVRDTVYAKDGKFVFEGSVEDPILCQIMIMSKENPNKGNMIMFMLENGETEIKATHIDSVPSWINEPGNPAKEKNVSINAGQAQREYAEFKAFTSDAEARMNDAYIEAVAAEQDSSASEEAKASTRKAFEDIQAESQNLLKEFAFKHPAYCISLSLLEMNLSEPFSYDGTQLDALSEEVAKSPWTHKRDAILKLIENYRRHAANMPYHDFTALTQDGKETKLSEYVGNGNYVFIDFWASWCGPCRAAIPHVKELYAKYPKGLTILSVSIDRDKAQWLKALDKEKMMWPQLWAPEEYGRPIMTDYEFRSIPTMVVIAPDGSIALETHKAENVSAFLEKHLN